MTPTYLYEPLEESLTFTWNMDIQGSYCLLSTLRITVGDARQMENNVSHIKYHLNYRDELHALLS